MKRKIFTLALSLVASVSAFAQLPDGSIAPDFTLKDINGTTHNLYNYLQQGKTVFIDVSAAWCAPCWNFHQTHALSDLYKQHGPTGFPNVNASTTNDVMVIWVEGETTNTRAQLYGPAVTSGTRANVTQGDWVTGTPFPIIDTNASVTSAFNTAWKIAAFPTIYMVCRDRLVTEVGQLSAAQLYSAATSGCPNYAPSATVDAKVVSYTGGSYYVCNANPTVRFQNYSTTTPISSATIKTYNGATLVNTYNWTGTAVQPYGIASVTIPSFAASNFDGYKYEVVVTNDSRATNNTSTGALYKVYSAANSVVTPWSENFEAVATMPTKMVGTDERVRPFKSQGTYNLIGANGVASRALMIPFAEMEVNEKVEAVLGNFNSSAATNVAIDFDLAHANIATKTDKIDIMVSKDCGATWVNVWSKSGAALGTTPPPSAGAFVPTAANQWRHESVVISDHKGNNMVVKVVATANGSHYAFMDNIKITNTLNVANVIAAGSVTVYPNPARESAMLDFTLSKGGKVSVSVLDAVGRTVAVVADATMQAGAQHINIPTSAMAAGIYNIAIQTEEGTFTQRLTVAK